MNKAHKFIFAALCLGLIFVIGYRRDRIGSVAEELATMPAPTPYPMPTPTVLQAPQPTVVIDPELQRRADVALSGGTIFRLNALEDKLKNQDAFMQECRTMNRQQLLQTVEDMARIIGNYQQKLPQR